MGALTTKSLIGQGLNDISGSYHSWLLTSITRLLNPFTAEEYWKRYVLQLLGYIGNTNHVYGLYRLSWVNREITHLWVPTWRLTPNVPLPFLRDVSLRKCLEGCRVHQGDPWMGRFMRYVASQSRITVLSSNLVCKMNAYFCTECAPIQLYSEHYRRPLSVCSKTKHRQSTISTRCRHISVKTSKRSNTIAAWASTFTQTPPIDYLNNRHISVNSSDCPQCPERRPTLLKDWTPLIHGLNLLSPHQRENIGTPSATRFLPGSLPLVECHQSTTQLPRPLPHQHEIVGLRHEHCLILLQDWTLLIHGLNLLSPHQRENIGTPSAIQFHLGLYLYSNAANRLPQPLPHRCEIVGLPSATRTLPKFYLKTEHC